MSGRLPVVSYLDADQGRVVAAECASCGALHLDARTGCGRCAGTALTSRTLETTGTIRTFTIVHRSMPGIEVPFTSVVVDLDGGGTVRGSLTNTVDHPAGLTGQTRVRMVTRVIGTDTAGTDAIGYAFQLEDQ